MSTALIAGIGNVLLGDDGVGPYVVRLIESRYEFGQEVSVADLGTPALDLTHQIAGLRSLIVVDSVASDEPAGTVVLFRKPDLLSRALTERLDPHSPALSECLWTAEMLGASPEHVLLVGIVGESYEPGTPLSFPVRAAVETAMDAVLHELGGLGYAHETRTIPAPAGIWWAEASPGGQPAAEGSTILEGCCRASHRSERNIAARAPSATR